MFTIQPLTKESLLKAQALAAKLFPWEDEHQDALAAVVADSDSTGFLLARGLEQIRAWCLMADNRVVGIASLYEYRSAPDEVWLAWFGLSPEVRGLGLGGTLLDGVIALARREHKSVLRLWTTDEEEYATALKLYARRGFKPEIQTTLPGENWETVVFSLALKGGIVARPWRGTLSGAQLCGRVVPVAA